MPLGPRFVALLVCASAPLGLGLPERSAQAEATEEPRPTPLDIPAAAGKSELDLFSLESQVATLAVSISSKREESVEEVPGSVTVITKEMIRDMNALTLRDVLNVYVPSMDVVPTYFRYGDRVNEGIYSRGILSDFSQQVLILYNGQTKFNEPTYGSPFVAVQFNLENIERIEISRSPVPIQGGGAMTVINLVTKEQFLRNSGQAFLDLSANDRDITGRVVEGLRATGIFGYEMGPLRLSGSVQYYRDSGQAHREPAGRGDYMFDADTLRDGVKNAANFTVSLQSKDERFTFQNWFQYTGSDAFLSALVPSQSSDLYKYEGRMWLSVLRVRPLASRPLSISAGSTLGTWTILNDFAGSPYGINASFYDVYVEPNYEVRFDSGGQHSLLTGLRFEREGQFDASIYTFDGRILSENRDPAAIVAPNVARNVFSAYADEVWRISGGQAIITGGVRLDLFQGFGDRLELAPSGRLAILYNAGRILSLKLLYATTIRPPQIYERLGVSGLPLLGSQNVDSERMHEVELSLIARHRGLRAQLTPFFEWFDNQIQYLPSGSFFTAHNNGATGVVGVELDARYTFSPGRYLFLNGSYLRSYDVSGQKQTEFLPSAYLNGGGNFRWKGLNLNTTAYFRDRRPLPSDLVENSAHTTYHFMWSATVSYTLWGMVRPYFLVENITDQLNNVPLSKDGLMVPMRGRTYHLGIAIIPGLGKAAAQPAS